MYSFFVQCLVKKKKNFVISSDRREAIGFVWNHNIWESYNQEQHVLCFLFQLFL